jgi:membrane protease subunit HflK
MYYETMEKVLANNDKVITEGSTTSYLPLPEVRRKADAAADSAASGSVTVTGGQ